MNQLASHTATAGDIGVYDMVYAGNLQFAFTLVAVRTRYDRQVPVEGAGGQGNIYVV